MSPAPIRHEEVTSPRRRWRVGRVVFALVVALLVAAWFGWSWDDLLPQAADGPGHLVEGRAELIGDRGYALAAQRVTPAEAGDLRFDDGALLLLGGAGGPHRFITDLGPMQLNELKTAPRVGYGPRAPLKVGHVYAVRLKSESRVRYAKLRVIDVIARVDGGLFGKDTPGSLKFDYAMQLNGTRRFTHDEPEDSATATLVRRRDRLQNDRDALMHKLSHDIPQLQVTLARQAAEVRQQLAAAATPQTEATLQRELREIARMAVALDRHGAKIQNTLVLIDSAVRNLARRIQSEALLGEDAGALLAQTASIERESAALLEVQLTEAGVGDNAIDQQAVDRKLMELGGKEE